MADEQITLRFESTLDSSGDSPLLLSGPIELFASVDKFEDLYTEEMDAVLKEEQNLNHLVVFVNDVTNGAYPNSDSQPNRGAYFLFVPISEDKPFGESNKVSALNWQEILLGTHSHSNPNALESIERLPLEENSNGKVVGVKDGEYVLLDKSDASSQLPELPIDIRNYKTQLEEYKKLHEPTDEEWHHLDAPLDQLEDTYDWLRKDENGNYTNIAVGNCRQLYHSLIKANKKLYLNNDYKLSREEKNSIGSLLLEAFLVNYDTTKNEPLYENAIQDQTNQYHLILKLSFPFNFDEKDELFLFDGEDGKEDYYLNDSEYTIQSKNLNELVIILNKNRFQGIRKLTVLAIHNFTGSRMCFVENKLNLYTINNELIKLYIEGEFSRKPNLPKYYLSTDAEGTIRWDNKLLPTQTFYHESKTITKDDIKNDSTDIIIEFDSPYRIDEDYPLLMINDYFAFDLIPDSSKDKITYHISKNRDIGICSIDQLLEDGQEIKLTLVVIKKVSSGDIADELAKNYITKADAVNILSHGKLKLNDYATKADLNSFAILNHKHSEYALKTHNHDYRYAMYHHTHPELAGLIASMTGVDESKIKEWLDKVQNSNDELLKKFIESLGLFEKNGKYFIEDKNTILSEESWKAIDKYFTDNPRLQNPGSFEGKSVGDALVQFAKLFELDAVKDSQVILEDPITSQYNIGGIVKGQTFEKDSELRDLLTQLLNPYISVENAIKILTPTKVLLEWYEMKTSATGDMNDDTQFIKIDPKHLLRYKIEQDQKLYFKIIGWLNESNEECKLEFNKNGKKMVQYIELKFSGDDNKFHSYIIDNVDDLDNISPLEFIWSIKNDEEKNIVYDNYGLKSENFSSKILEQKPEFKYGAPAIFIGTVEPKLDTSGYPLIENSIYEQLVPYFLDKQEYLILDVSSGKNLIILLVKQNIAENEDLVIRNCFTGNRIEDFFVQIVPADWKDNPKENKCIEYDGTNYVPMVYDVQTQKFEKLKITVERLTKVGGET